MIESRFTPDRDSTITNATVEATKMSRSRMMLGMPARRPPRSKRISPETPMIPHTRVTVPVRSAGW
jgi:hypothetical protein